VSTEQHALKNVNNCLNTNIYSCLETSVGQRSNPYLNTVPWQLKTAIFLHWCLMCAAFFSGEKSFIGLAPIEKTNELI
jgi:hypothetical protein